MSSESILKFWITRVNSVGINDGGYCIELFSGPKFTIEPEPRHNTGKVHAGSLVKRKEMVVVRNINRETVGMGTFQSNITTLWSFAGLRVL